MRTEEDRNNKSEEDRNNKSTDDLISLLQNMCIPDENCNEIIVQLMIASRVPNNSEILGNPDLNMIKNLSRVLNVRDQTFKHCSLEIIMNISFLESCKLYMVSEYTGLIDALKNLFMCYNLTAQEEIDEVRMKIVMIFRSLCQSNVSNKLFFADKKNGIIRMITNTIHPEHSYELLMKVFVFFEYLASERLNIIALKDPDENLLPFIKSVRSKCKMI